MLGSIQTERSLGHSIQETMPSVNITIHSTTLVSSNPSNLKPLVVHLYNASYTSIYGVSTV